METIFPNYRKPYLWAFYFHDIRKDNCFANLKRQKYIIYMILHIHVISGKFTSFSMQTGPLYWKCEIQMQRVKDSLQLILLLIDVKKSLLSTAWLNAQIIVLPAKHTCT